MFAPPFISSSICGYVEPAMSYRPVRPLAFASPLTFYVPEFGSDSTATFLTSSFVSTFKLLALFTSESCPIAKGILMTGVAIESF